MKKSFLKRYTNISNIWNKATKRYTCIPIANSDEKLACLNIRHSAFKHELYNQCDEKESHEGISDDVDSVSTLFAIRDNRHKKIIGTLRITAADKALQFSNFHQRYQLEKIPTTLLPKVAIVSCYTIDPTHRHNVINLVTLLESYQYCLQHGFTLALIICTSNFYQMYSTLGFQLSSELFISEFGGYRFLMLLPLTNFDYLKSINSPLYQIAKKLHLPQCHDTLTWYNQQDFSFNDVRLQPINDQINNNNMNIPILQGIRKSITSKIVESCLHIIAQPGDCIAKKGTLMSEVGYLATGTINILADNHILYLLHPGSIFGEESCINHTPLQTDIIVAEKSEIFLFNYRLLTTLTSKDHELIWQNMIKLLVQKQDLLYNQLKKTL
ncbi:MAG: cyclic nucleotide-binding domain-containing protein [Gammaproteobacteria bacterium]|nr:cyclic nucleotide-binding domain-containing protein [Gammaproteobacteria bacterium]